MNRFTDQQAQVAMRDAIADALAADAADSLLMLLEVGDEGDLEWGIAALRATLLDRLAHINREVSRGSH
jgi:hypothetical protein